MVDQIHNAGQSKASYIYHNQNRYIPGEEKPLLSSAQSGREWAKANIDSGRYTSDLLEVSFFVDIIKNYFNSFLNPQENVFVGAVTKTLNAVSGFFDGTRDKIMYEDVYAKGLDEVNKGKLSGEQIANQEESLGDDIFRDDMLENNLLQTNHNERIIHKFWTMATKMAGIKPYVSLVSGFLGDGLRNVVDTVLETPGRGLWRLRFFPGSLHANFVSTVWDLTRSKFLSVFGNKEARAEFDKKCTEVGELSQKYFENKTKPKDESGDTTKREPNPTDEKPGLGLYVKMLKDRMTGHWRGIWNPEEALQKKLDDGFLTPTSGAERKEDAGKTMGKGFVRVDEIKGKDGKVYKKISESDIKHQRMFSISDFTGPICAGLGLVGSFVFDPLKVVWSVAGITTGKNLINALSASRKSFSLFNYIFRFINEEIAQGKQYSNLASAMNSKDGGEPKKAVREMYYAMKSRYVNGLLGMAVACGNIVEPFFHLFRSSFEENKLANFLFGVYLKFNDNGLVRLFSKRRECMGRIEDLNALARQKMDSKKPISINDYSLITDSEFDQHVESRSESTGKTGLGGILRPFLSRLTNAYDGVVKAFTGDYEGIDAAGVKTA